jgi:hypothetical protein
LRLNKETLCLLSYVAFFDLAVQDVIKHDTACLLRVGRNVKINSWDIAYYASVSEDVGAAVIRARN